MIIIPDKSKYSITPNKYTNPFFQVNDTLSEIYNSGRLYNGEKLTAQTNPDEGYFIYDLIKKNKYKNCLEIGMANGISALFICQALAELNNNGSLISIDPYQSTQWKNQGVENIKRAGLKKYHALAEKFDYTALPHMLINMQKSTLEKFDLIFIDGDHRFDYTLLDFMYSDMMLKVGGVILVDDVRHKSVRPVINYLERNYKHFKMLKGPNASESMALFIKIGEDKRSWDFHVNFQG
jgi:predicted O-methyltransferase YrrM